MQDSWDDILERSQQDNAWWLPAHITTMDRPEIHYTVDSSGPTRLNTVNRVNPDQRDYDPLVREVMQAHQPQGRSHFSLARPSQSPALAESLARHGYVLEDMADAWSIEVTAARPPIPDDVRVDRVETLQGLRDMYAVMHASFPRIDPAKGADLAKELSECSGAQARCRRYVAYDAASGAPLSTGALNLFPDHGVGFMWGGSTVPAARGRGVYTAVVTARMRNAREAGLRRVALYALRKTSGPIIQRQGFTRHGPVEFWSQYWENK